MKPTADMLTSILHNFRVNGKFDQDRLIIGCGTDEVLTLKIGMDVPGLKTATFNNVTYYRRPDMDQLVYDPSIIKNVFGDTQTGTPTRVLYYDDGTKSWYGLPYVEGSSSIGSSQPMYKADGGTADSLEGSIWHYLTGGADVWPCTVGEIGGVIAPTIRYTPGHANGKQFKLTPVESEAISAKLEYTNDGTTWYPFGASGSVNIEYEPIEFDQSYLSSDGIIKIQHNFNNPNILCLGYSIQPKEITYLDNELVLDYSDQNTTSLSGAVWFIGSQQGMLTQPPAKPEWVLSGCLDENVNGAYLPIKESDWPKYIPQETIDKCTIFQVWVNTNDKYILVTFNPSSINTIGVVPSGEWSDIPTYRRYFPNSQIPTDLSGITLPGSGDDTITITKYTGDNA